MLPLKQLKNEPWFAATVAAWVSLFALGLIDNSRGPVFPDLLREYGLTNVAGSNFYFIASLFATMHNIAFHRFLSRRDPGHLIAIYTFAMALGGIAIALAPTWPLCLVGAAILGIGFGGVGVAQNAAVQLAPQHYRSRALGTLHSMYGISSFLAPLGVSAAVGLGWGWRAGVLGLSGLALLASLGFFLSWSRIGTTSASEQRQSRELDRKIGSPSGVRWLVATFVGFIVVAEVSVSSRLALLARSDWALSSEAASLWLSGYFLSMTLARMALGLYHLPISTSKSLRVLLVLAIFPMTAALFGGVVESWLSVTLRLGSLLLYAIFIAALYPLVMAYIQETFGPFSQSVTSLSVTVQSVFGMGMHFSLGWLADSVGVLRALQIVTGGSLLGALGVFLWVERLQLRHGASRSRT